MLTKLNGQSEMVVSDQLYVQAVELCWTQTTGIEKLWWQHIFKKSHGKQILIEDICYLNI